MRKYLLIIFICLNLMFVISCEQETYIYEEVEKTTITDIRIDIKGAVKYPGVYLVPSNYLMKDLIKDAGGLLENADVNKINMVLPLFDNQMINIPYLSNEHSNNELININTSTVEELTSLPGIGESKALNIIKYREENGGFKNIEEIKNVSGIGEDVFSKIKTYITV